MALVLPHLSGAVLDQFTFGPDEIVPMAAIGRQIHAAFSRA